MTQNAQGHDLSGATTSRPRIRSGSTSLNLVHGYAIGLFEDACLAALDFAMAYLGKVGVFALANGPGLITLVS